MLTTKKLLSQTKIVFKKFSTNHQKGTSEMLAIFTLILFLKVEISDPSLLYAMNKINKKSINFFHFCHEREVDDVVKPESSWCSNKFFILLLAIYFYTSCMNVIEQWLMRSIWKYFLLQLLLFLLNCTCGGCINNVLL